MAPDFALPMREIIVHSICELKYALEDLRDDPEFRARSPWFKPDQWAASIALSPTVDTSTYLRGGMTGKTSQTDRRFFSWVLGTGTGAGLEAKGQSSGSATYVVHSAAILQRDLDCTRNTFAYNALAQNLGIRGWLKRVAEAADFEAMGGTAALEKTSFGAKITIKMDGAGTFTYNFPNNVPFGTEFGAASGSYQLETILNIAFTDDPPKPPRPPVPRTFPGREGVPPKGVAPPRRPAAVAPSGVSEPARQRLDNIQLEQILRNLQIR